MYIFKSDSVARIWNKKKNSGNLIGNSKFLRSTEVSYDLDLSVLPKSGTCLVLVCSELTSQDFKFNLSISVNDNSISKDLWPELTVLPVHQRIVRSKWTEDLCAGYNQISNPQFSLKVASDMLAHIQLSLDDGPGSLGIAWILYKSTEKTGRLLMKDKDSVVSKSPFRSGRAQVDATVELKANESYVLIACIEKFVQDTSFAITVSSSSAEGTKDSESAMTLQGLHPVSSMIKGEWTKSSSNGAYSLTCPQIMLELSSSSKSACQALITLTRSQGEASFNESGVRFIVFQKTNSSGNHPSRILRHPKEGEKTVQTVAKSKYMVASHLSSHVQLEPANQYIIAALLEKEDTCGGFNLQVDLSQGDKPRLENLEEPIIAHVQAEWTKSESGGVRSLHNPQIYVKTSKSAESLHLEMRRPEGGPEEGMRFVVYSAEDKVRLIETPAEELLVGKSAFVKDPHVSMTISVAPDKRKFIVMGELGNGEVIGSFSLSAQSSANDDVSMEILPAAHIFEDDAQWKGPTAGGYKGPANPQWQITCDTDTWISAELLVPSNRKDKKGSVDGVCIQLYKGVEFRFGRRRRQLNRNELVATSKFIAGPKTELVHKELKSSDSCPYVLVAFTEKEGKDGEANYSIRVRSGSPLKIERLPDRKDKVTPKEDDCDKVLKRLKKYDPETNEEEERSYRRCALLYKHDPLEAVEKYCRENNCLFVDKEFKPCDSSLSNANEKNIKPVVAAKWKRLSDVRDNPKLFVGNEGTANAIDPNDVVQGNVGDCWLVSLLRCSIDINLFSYSRMYCLGTSYRHCRRLLYAVKYSRRCCLHLPAHRFVAPTP